jgi:hypothetical protein
VKTRFQAFAFKCSLYRYAEVKKIVGDKLSVDAMKKLIEWKHHHHH